MRIDPLGDSAVILREFAHPAHAVAERLNASDMPGSPEAVASYDTVGVYFSEPLGDLSEISRWVAGVEGQVGGAALSTPKIHIVPVCYELGDDLEEVAGLLGLSVPEVVRLHESVEYHCFAIGFCPGFPYLGYLPGALEGVPRKVTPRVRITPGSVAITGRQTGIYPMERPGGWSILGRTPLTIVEPEVQYFPISAGDKVRFTAIGLEEFEERKGERL